MQTVSTPQVIGTIIAKSYIDFIIFCFSEKTFLHFFKKFHIKWRARWPIAQPSRRETKRLLILVLCSLKPQVVIPLQNSVGSRQFTKPFQCLSTEPPENKDFFTSMFWLQHPGLELLFFLNSWRRKIKIKRNILKYSCMTKVENQCHFLLSITHPQLHLAQWNSREVKASKMANFIIKMDAFHSLSKEWLT